MTLIPTKLRRPSPDELPKLFALGSDTGNLQLGLVMMSVLFLREHNRVARMLQLMIVQLIKIVIEEYINHITPYHFKFRADPKSFKDPPWYRTNSMAIEFHLVYRWHPLVPTR